MGKNPYTMNSLERVWQDGHDSLKAEIVKARLKEAKWWAKQDHVHTISTDPKDLCYCKRRIKWLRAKAKPKEKAGLLKAQAACVDAFHTLFKDLSALRERLRTQATPLLDRLSLADELCRVIKSGDLTLINQAREKIDRLKAELLKAQEERDRTCRR